ncbi:helicase associated domain-containing protein [Streptomyces olivaceoviridis]|uniref:Helicase associated domain-containing protein n=1 Tax=Streptomyces olivaceoviridis TaxID=1921 RepID=A0ABW7VC74_STROI
MYVREHGDLKVPFTYRVPGGQDQAVEAEGWPASLANFPLGQWIADNRRFYARGDMDEERVERLEKLGMVWSHFDVAWEEGLAAAHEWAEVNGHLLAPKDATYQGYKVGIWLKNARATARKAAEIEQRRAEGLPVQSSAGALSDERREQLEDIDPSWCPSWPVEWQRAFHLVRLHLEAYWSPTSSNPPPPPRRRLRWRTRARLRRWTRRPSWRQRNAPGGPWPHRASGTGGRGVPGRRAECGAHRGTPGVHRAPGGPPPVPAVHQPAAGPACCLRPPA